MKNQKVKQYLENAILSIDQAIKILCEIKKDDNLMILLVLSKINIQSFYEINFGKMVWVDTNEKKIKKDKKVIK